MSETVVILHNSHLLGFNLDASKIYQPEKYDLHLIVNEKSYHILNDKNQARYYKDIVVTEDFSRDVLVRDLKSKFQDRQINVVTGSEDTLPICGEVRLALGIDPNDYARFYNKHVMKTKLAGLQSIKTPKYCLFDYREYLKEGEAYLKMLVKDLRYPLFAKPTQMFGSIGLKKILSETDLYQWAKLATSEDQYEIDEFIEGVMYHCESYIKNGKILFTFVSQNSRPCYDFTVGQIKGTIVLPQESLESMQLQSITQDILEKLGMPIAGVTHLELIKTKEGDIYFVEIAHRSPGCLIPKMHLVRSGVDTASAHFLLQIDPEYSPKPVYKEFSAWACYPKVPGVVKALHAPKAPLASHCEFEWHVQLGERVTSFSQFGRDYTGTVFMTHEDFETLYADFDTINQTNLCEITAA